MLADTRHVYRQKVSKFCTKMNRSDFGVFSRMKKGIFFFCGVAAAVVAADIKTDGKHI